MKYIETVIKKEWNFIPYDDGVGGYYEKDFGNISVLYCEEDGLSLFFNTDAGEYRGDVFDIVSLVAKLQSYEKREA